MTTELSNFAARLRETICSFSNVGDDVRSLALQNRQLSEPPHVSCCENELNALAIELFTLQFRSNVAYRKICEARGSIPNVIEHWAQIPAVPASAFKELDLTCLAPAERTAVFHSSGTTEQKPSRHFHNAESLAVYEASLWPWFEQNFFDSSKFKMQNSKLVILTPPPVQTPHSSLVHMFETIRRKLGAAEAAFVGKISDDGIWTLDFDATLAVLDGNSKSKTQNPKLILGTAFSFVHLLDYLAKKDLCFDLPAGSRVMETGGYKNRSRSMPKTELHRLITEQFGVPAENIICEYGMSELSSQAYDLGAQASRRRVFPGATKELGGETSGLPESIVHHFHFPPWAKVRIISPETGGEVADGKTGLIRVFDLANVFSVMAIQTEDLGIRRDDEFELIGRATLAEPRGCSLMMLVGSASSLPRSKWGIDKTMPSKK